MSDNVDLKSYKPNNRELIYLQGICNKLEDTGYKLPSDLKPKSKIELIYDEIYNNIK